MLLDSVVKYNLICRAS